MARLRIEPTPDELRFYTRDTHPERFLSFFGWIPDPKRKPKDGAPQSIFVDRKTGKRTMHVFKASRGPKTGDWMWKLHDGDKIDGRSSGTIIHMARASFGGNDDKESFAMAVYHLRGSIGYDPVAKRVPDYYSCLSGPANSVLTHRKVQQNSTDAANDGSPGQAADPQPTFDEIRAAYYKGARAILGADRLPDYMVDRGLTTLEPTLVRRIRVNVDTGALRFPILRFTEGQQLELIGYEEKGPGAADIPKGTSDKGLWTDGNPKSRTVFCVENPIESISHHLLHVEQQGLSPVMYVAIQPGGEATAANYLKFKIASGEFNRVILGFENTFDGHDRASAMYRNLGAGHHGRILRDVPPGCVTSWNDALQSILKDEAEGPTFRAHLDDRMLVQRAAYIADQKAKAGAERAKAAAASKALKDVKVAQDH